MGAFQRSTATLRLCADDLDPREITRALGRKPTSSLRKGETIYRRGEAKGVSERNIWRLQTPEREPGDLNAQINELFETLTSDLAVWRDLTTRADLDLFCGLFMAEMNEVAALSPASLGALSARGVELVLDVYDSGRVGPRWQDGEFIGNGSDYD